VDTFTAERYSPHELNLGSQKTPDSLRDVRKIRPD